MIYLCNSPSTEKQSEVSKLVNSEGYKNYQELKEIEVSSGIINDSIILGYDFNMSSLEYDIYTEKLKRKNKVIQKGKELTFELSLDDKQIPFKFNIGTYKDKLNFFRAVTHTEVKSSLVNYLKEHYGDYQYTYRDKMMEDDVYNWVFGNQEITVRKSFATYSNMTILIYRDLSNQESTEEFRKRYLESKGLNTNKWYDGGTLHNSSVTSWRNATYKNKLATCGDWMATVNNKISMEELKDRAEKLLICIDEAVAMDKNGQEISGNLKCADIATSCITILR